MKVHQQQRHRRFATIEEPLALAEALSDAANRHDVILVDCLTLWITNLMMDERDIDAAGAALVRQFESLFGNLILVSNEVGLGIVPDSALARRFRDAQGVLNQRLAAQVARVIMMVAGVAVLVKSP